MEAFISMAVVNTIGAVAIATGTAPIVAPILGFAQVGITAGSIAATAHSWYGGALAGGSVISQLMSIAMR